MPPADCEQFSATAYDQFDRALITQPAFAWSVSGGGKIDASGEYSPPYAAGSATIRATAAWRDRLDDCNLTGRRPMDFDGGRMVDGGKLDWIDFGNGYFTAGAPGCSRGHGTLRLGRSDG